MINRSLIGVLITLVCVSCASTRRSDIVRNSGFLSDYSRLSIKNDEGVHWVSPGFSLDDYAEVIVPKVEVWLSEDNRRDISEESVGMLATLYHDQAVEKLATGGWKVVDKAGPGTITVRLALTELGSPNQIGSILSSIPYMTTQAIQLTAMAADVHVFVGEASTEVQILDSTTGKLLAESMDRQVGQHSMLNMGSTWADVSDAIDVWITRLGRGFSRK